MRLLITQASGVSAIPRNSTGSYSLPPGTLVSSGDTVLVSQHNPPMVDIEKALSSSLDRDGKGGMRADLPMGGNKITNLKPGTGPSDAVTVSQLGGTASIPIGAVIDFWGSTPPDGYLFCAGQAISRSTYSTLFGIMGTAAGAGDGTTTFNLPDYRGRIGAGRDNMNGTNAARLSTISGNALNATGGAQTHTLTTAQMPAHSHNVTDPGHTHTTPVASAANSSFGETQDTARVGSGVTASATTGITIAPQGGGEAHNILQPTIVCNKIMKVL